MAKRNDEVKESVMEMARIFQPRDPRKFVKEYVKKYRIMGGYEDELTLIVETEMQKMKLASLAQG
ncbi:hypothetical protein SY83_12735 [Paenibacillus swuensis]|uniref:Uncharacterized protein n=1 Tax=Paenibacillus swuensis TaxID=1178515 RepID=A0A172TJ55_9BACL|nr:hypothetical protein [Paenibacillus swuensis]ANE46996.1 hypothetical protein SY83_12735 [Paenibacillus swuensis]